MSVLSSTPMDLLSYQHKRGKLLVPIAPNPPLPDPNKLSGDELIRLGVVGSSSTLAFARLFWPVIEPVERPFVDGWHVGCVAEHLDEVSRPGGCLKNIVINVPPRSMKPIYEHENVLMGDGSRKLLKDVVVGDMVIGKSGRAAEVAAVHIQGMIPTVTINTFCGRSVRMAPDHPVMTPRGWIEAAKLIPGEAVAISSRQLFSNNRETKTSEEFRLAGYFVGDGCTASGSTGSFFANITSGDMDYQDDIIQCISVMGFSAVMRDKAKKTKGVKTINVSGGVRPWLESIGLDRKTSYTKRVPEFVFSGSADQVANFIAAYFHCDGCAYAGGGGLRISFSSVSKDLLGDIRHLLTRVGVSSRVRTRELKKDNGFAKAGYISYTLDISGGEDTARFCERIPVAGPKRKKIDSVVKPRATFDSEFLPDVVVSVTSSGEGHCRCLTVPGEDSFVAGDMVVHNSLLTCVFWFCKVWATRPGTRWIFSSFSDNLVTRDSVRCRDIIRTPLYQALWPLQIKANRDTQGRYDNNEQGFRYSVTVAGSGGMGDGGDFLVCFPYSTLIDTEHGRIPIGQIVEERLPVWVTAYDHDDDRRCFRQIEAYESNPGRDSIEIGFSNGISLEPTLEHPIFVLGRGYTHAANVCVGDWCMTSGQKAQVTSIRSIPTPERVYNIRVREHANYFANGILVHNCDDPANPRLARSTIERENAISWWRTTMSGRFVDPKTVRRVIIAQRLNERDLCGYLLAENLGYSHLCLPMRYEQKRYWYGSDWSNIANLEHAVDLVKDIISGEIVRPRDAIVLTPLQKIKPSLRDPRTDDGQILWPERIPEKEVAAQEKELGPDVPGQYQQRPSAAGGDIFKDEYFRRFKALWDTEEDEDTGERRSVFAGVELHGPGLDQVRVFRAKQLTAFQVIDTASTEGKRSAFTAIITAFATTEHDIVVWDMTRVKIEVPRQFELLKALRGGPATWDQKTRVISSHGLWPLPLSFQAVEAKSSGIGLIQEGAAAGMPFYTLRADGDKVQRSIPVTTMYANGKVYHPSVSVPWVRVLEDEEKGFPNSTFKDTVDCMSYIGYLLLHDQILRGQVTNKQLAFSTEIEPEESIVKIQTSAGEIDVEFDDHDEDEPLRGGYGRRRRDL